MAQTRRNRENFDQNALLREIVFALLASVQKKPDLQKALKYLQRAEKKINGN